MSARTGRAFGAVLAALLLTAAAEPESRLAEYQRVRREAVAAAQAGDLATAEEKLDRAVQLFPDVPGGYIRLARVQAAAGNLEGALRNVQLYAGMGLTLDVGQDPALKALIDSPDYADIAWVLADNARPIGEVTALATIAGDPEFIGEGLFHDGRGWLLSTVAGRTIVRLTPGGHMPFLQTDVGTGAIFGMAVDRRRGLLWAAEAWGDGVPGGSGAARTGLLKVSLKDGAILGRIPLPEGGVRRQIGDVVVARDGTVYATESVAGGVWRLKAGSVQLEQIVGPGHMASPQGMFLCPGETAMLVADYATGLHRIDLSSGEATPVEGLKAGLAGTDGLVAAPDVNFGMRRASPLPLGAIVTQNGVSPQRVLLLRINPECSEVEEATPLAAGLPGMDDVTLAAVRGNEAVFVGHGRWDARDANSRLTTPMPAPIRVFSLTLPSGSF